MLELLTVLELITVHGKSLGNLSREHTQMLWISGCNTSFAFALTVIPLWASWGTECVGVVGIHSTVEIT